MCVTRASLFKKGHIDSNAAAAIATRIDKQLMEEKKFVKHYRIQRELIKMSIIFKKNVSKC